MRFSQILFTAAMLATSTLAAPADTSIEAILCGSINGQVISTPDPFSDSLLQRPLLTNYIETATKMVVPATKAPVDLPVLQ
ncbi:hypothetical protein BT63DRAFT_428991 [Microthyrium microscopicum]|uniref:Uncharacterized protein n=1 Tax=Microthyrium microscopicum TaxID=703497 RepID=A0A6A6TY69_9PEZI|nr:hypothetical protein BT63DRAFT_428991 [Microthyrium microscopicum]